MSDYYQQAIAELTKRQLQELLALLQPLEDTTDPIDALSDEERRAFCSRIATVYPDIERILLFAFRIQLQFLGLQASGDPQFYGARGGLNMADVLLERFRGYRDEHLQHIKDQRDQEGTSDAPVPSVTERG